MDYEVLCWIGKDVGLEVKPDNDNKLGENEKVKDLEISMK